MASLHSLPAELQLSIFEHLDLTATSFIPAPSRDLLNLSRKTGGSSISTVLHSAHAKHVQHVHYIGVMAMPECTDDEDAPVTEPSPDDFPESLEHVFSSLAKLPNLERVTVQFVCAKTAEEDEEIHQLAYDIFEELETDKQVLEAKKTIAFRSLMERSYRALSRNPALSIKHLELKNIVTRRCSVWNLAEFHALLQGVSSFTISLHGGGNGACWQINMIQGYLDFVSELHNYFFKHLSNVKHFSFAATNDGPPGIEGGINNAALTLLEQHMPKLQSLLLEYVFIGEDLSAFITAHSSTLELIQLNHCYSGSGDEDAICWGDFFSRITSKKMRSLRAFKISASDLERSQPTRDDRSYEVIVRARQWCQQFPDRRMFDYKGLDDKYGMVDDSEDQAFERFETGSDHTSWEQLCKLIRENG